MTVKLSLHDVNPVAIQLPQRVTLEVADTEPVTKGQTASSSYKPAILSNGVRTACRRISAGNADRGDDRRRLLRRTCQGLRTRIATTEYGRRGAIALNRMAVRFLVRWLAVFCLLCAGLAGAAAEAFRTPSISAVRVEWRAVLDQLRTEIGPVPRSPPGSASRRSGAYRLPTRARRPRWCN